MPIDGLGLPSNEKKKKRDYVNRKDVLKLHGNQCKICGKSDKEVPLEMAHFKAHSKGGNLVFPACPNCHTKFDKGLSTSKELKKLNLTKEEYQRYRPKKPKPKTEANPLGINPDFYKLPKMKKGKGFSF